MEENDRKNRMGCLDFGEMGISEPGLGGVCSLKPRVERIEFESKERPNFALESDVSNKPETKSGTPQAPTDKLASMEPEEAEARRPATALQHYLLYSALSTTTPKQATEEDRPSGTAGGRWRLSPEGCCASPGSAQCLCSSPEPQPGPVV